MIVSLQTRKVTASQKKKKTDTLKLAVRGGLLVRCGLPWLQEDRRESVVTVVG